MEVDLGLVIDNDVRLAANKLASDLKSDVFFYNGTITRNNVLAVMDCIQKYKSSDRLFLVMVTYGGDPHAAFKISRYIQDHYEYFTLFVPGFCKSAGTLFAIAANEIVFAPFGELGPLDVQMAKPDQFQFDSGLVIGESLDTLERRASETFKRMFAEVMAEQQGLISVNSALHAASEITKAIYAPIMARIDPEEVGVRQRALRIALDYGGRLAIKSQNAGSRTVKLLAEKYSSHSFVIDKQEAASLFRNVREASAGEMALAYALGADARIERAGAQTPLFKVLSNPLAENGTNRESEDEETERTGHPSPNGAGAGRADGSPVAASKQQEGGGGRGVRGRDTADGGEITTPAGTG